MPLENNQNIRVALCDAGKSFRGGQRQTFNLARGLDQAGIPVWVFCPAGGELHKRCLDLSLKVVDIKYDIRSLFSVVATIIKELKNNRINIFHASDSHSHNFGLAAKKLYPPIELVVSSRTCFVKPSIGFGKLKYASKGVSKFIAISEAVQQTIIKKGADFENIEIINSSVDREQFNTEEREDSKIFTIGTSASLEPDKGIEQIFTALKGIKSELGEFQFLIAGRGEMKDELNRLVESSGLTDRVKFLGFVDDMPEFYKTLDIFILASRSEGLGSSILEAGACGASVIGTKTGGIPEIISHEQDGYLFSVDATSTLAEFILKLKRSADLRKNISSRFMQKLEKFDIDYVTQKHIAIYTNLLQR